jgi:hypothetical protein
MNLKPNLENQSIYSRIDLLFLMACRAFIAFPTLLFYRNAIALREWAVRQIGLSLGMRSKCDFNRSLGGATASFAGLTLFQGHSGLNKPLNPAWPGPLLLGTC